MRRAAGAVEDAEEIERRDDADGDDQHRGDDRQDRDEPAPALRDLVVALADRPGSARGRGRLRRSWAGDPRHIGRAGQARRSPVARHRPPHNGTADHPGRIAGRPGRSDVCRLDRCTSRLLLFTPGSVPGTPRQRPVRPRRITCRASCTNPASGKIRRIPARIRAAASAICRIGYKHRPLRPKSACGLCRRRLDGTSAESPWLPVSAVCARVRITRDGPRRRGEGGKLEAGIFVAGNLGVAWRPGPGGDGSGPGIGGAAAALGDHASAGRLADHGDDPQLQQRRADRRLADRCSSFSRFSSW